MASASQEYVVRAPNENSKRFNVMRFANSLNVDVTKWKVARMERERSVKQENKVATEEAPKFGFGSEYGKDAKEEARRRKYGQYARKKDDSPWTLRVGGKNGKKFKGTREGGVTENTSYYVFFQAHDGAFEAFPVSEWYNFTAIPRYKPLTSEEAEERYEERHKIYNHFAVMASRKNTEGAEADQTETKLLKNMKKKKDFKVTDMDDWVDSDRSFDGGSDEEGEDGDTKKNGKGKAKGGKGKKKAGKKKKKGSDDDDDDSEPGEESDEGDHEAREVDYMSDSSSGSEEEDLEEKLNKELKGVEDEDALRKLVLSDDDEDEEEEGKAKEDAPGANKGVGEDAPKGNDADGKVKVKQEKSSDSDTSASDDSDDSDLDDSKFTSAMFLQRKTGSASKNKNGSEQKASSSRSTTPAVEQPSQSGNNSSNTNNNNNNSNTNTENGASVGGNGSEIDAKSTVKRKLNTSENSPVISKKPKTNDPNSGGEAISEEAVRRYLMRKPMTAAELLQKFKGRKVPLKGQDLVQTIAHILKKLNPDKQTIKGKLHLYIKPPTGP